MDAMVYPSLPGLKDADLFRQAALIGGQWLPAASGQTVAVTNPATGAVIGTVPDVSGAETAAAIAAADAAFQGWRKLPHATRAAALERWFALMEENAEDLALILTLEQGKPLAEAKGEIAYGASFVKWFAEEARRIDGTVIPAPTAGPQNRHRPRPAPESGSSRRRFARHCGISRQSPPPLPPPDRHRQTR